MSNRHPGEVVGSGSRADRSAESGRVENPFVHHCEYSPEVLLYVDQPITVEIKISKGQSYACDYLVVLEDGGVRLCAQDP